MEETETFGLICDIKIVRGGMSLNIIVFQPGSEYYKPGGDFEKC